MGTRIEAASALTSHGLRKPTARRLADAAARACLAHASREPGDVDMLFNAGIYREDNMGEPALAPLIQEDIGSGRLGEARTILMLAAGAGITVTLARYRQEPS